jgi:hypothetical protein
MNYQCEMCGWDRDDQGRCGCFWNNVEKPVSNDICGDCGRPASGCDCWLGDEPEQCPACGAYGCMDGAGCLGCGQGCVTLPADDISVVEGSRLPSGVGYPDEVLEVILG